MYGGRVRYAIDRGLGWLRRDVKGSGRSRRSIYLSSMQA